MITYPYHIKSGSTRDVTNSLPVPRKSPIKHYHSENSNSNAGVKWFSPMETPANNAWW